MKWEPWVTYKAELPVLNITAPPCSECKYWKPQTTYMSTANGVEFDGVRLCHNTQGMEPDFSCYVERKESV